MAINKGYSRFEFHTLSGLPGATFSVPTQEDFTLSGTGSWTINDLCLSEIGVNEDDEKAYIRIAGNIKEFQFVGTGSNAGSLEQTLAIGNDSGTYSIMMGTDSGIYSANGTSTLYLDKNTDSPFPQSNTFLLSTDGLNAMESYIQANTYSITMASNTLMTISSGLLTTLQSDVIRILSNTKTELSGQIIQFTGAAYNYIVSHPYIGTAEISLTASGTQDIATFSMPADNELISLKVVGHAYCNSPNRARVENMFAAFERYGGVVYQVSTTDTSVKDTFGDGTQFVIDTNGVVVRIRATNGGGLSTNFVVRYEIMKTI